MSLGEGSKTDRNPKMMQPRYAEAISQTLGIPVDQVQEGGWWKPFLPHFGRLTVPAAVSDRL